MILARPPPAGHKVVLEVRVAAPDLQRPLERGLGQRSAPEIGMHDHAGRVQGPPEARRAGGLQLLHGPLDEIARVVPGSDLFTRARECGAGGLDRKRRGLAGQSFVPGKLVHGRKLVKAHFQAV